MYLCFLFRIKAVTDKAVTYKVVLKVATTRILIRTVATIVPTTNMARIKMAITTGNEIKIILVVRTAALAWV